MARKAGMALAIEVKDCPRAAVLTLKTVDRKMPPSKTSTRTIITPALDIRRVLRIIRPPFPPLPGGERPAEGAGRFKPVDRLIGPSPRKCGRSRAHDRRCGAVRAR